MRTISEVVQERSQITELALLENKSVAYCTEYHGARLLDNQEGKTLLKIMHKELRLNTTAVCFSPDAAILAFANNNVINILHLKTKQIIKTIKTQSKNITLLAFCADYVIVGNDEGRVLQYRYDNSSLLSRVCSFPYVRKTPKESFVSSFATHGDYLACSGQGGALFVIDIHSQSSKKVLLEQGERINALCFIDENVLVSANVGGGVLVHYLNASQETKMIDAPFNNVKQVIAMPNPNFIAIFGDSDYIAIVDIKKGKTLHSKYVTFKSEIGKILLANDESILVALSNHKIVSVGVPSVAQLRKCLINNDVGAAYDLAENEPMLHESKEYKLLEKRYDSLYKEALSALMNQNKTLALKTISAVSEVKSKKEHIAKLFAAFENYNRFKVIYLEKKYALAYAMAEKFEALKLTPLYLKLEETYKENFVDAQRHISIGKDENAKALLQQYVAVITKRPVIKLLLSKDKNFMNFLKAIKEKNYQTIEELKTANPIFTQTPTYFAFNQTIENSINKIETFINEGELVRAKESLLNLKNTSFINQALTRLYLYLEQTQKLQNAYDANDFKTCYETLDAHYRLNATPLGVLLNKHWAKLMRECEDYALKANPKAIKETLDSLLLIETRKGKIGDLLRVSFQSKIKAFLAKKSFNSAQNIIYSYIDIFGSDSEIASLTRTYEIMSKNKLAITQERKDKNSRNMWLESEFIIDPS